MLIFAVRSLWAESRAPDPPARVWRDWALIAVIVPTAIVESVLRDDVEWRLVSLALAVALAFALLWRRTYPLATTAVVFGAVILLNIAAIVADAGPVGPDTMVFIVLFPYTLFRWGSGREMAIGLAFMLAAYVLGVTSDHTGVTDSVFGLLFLLFPGALGASVRYRAGYRLRERDQVVLRERERLAREVHDSVAHHVSGIAIRAQAGRVLAASDPGAAVDALEVIETEASRTLAELRRIVGILRDGAPDLSPQRGVARSSRTSAISRTWTYS